jgi:hypothetical protein
MGMHTYIKGFIEKDEKFKSMMEVWDACRNANIDAPDSVYDYFDGFSPNDPGVSMELPTDCYKKYSADGEDGYEIIIDRVPSIVKVIRVINSY